MSDRSRRDRETAHAALGICAGAVLGAVLSGIIGDTGLGMTAGIAAGLGLIFLLDGISRKKDGGEPAETENNEPDTDAQDNSR